MPDVLLTRCPLPTFPEGAIAYEWYANGNFVTSSADWTGTLENINNAIESQTVELVAHSVEGCNDTRSDNHSSLPGSRLYVCSSERYGLLSFGVDHADDGRA